MDDRLGFYGNIWELRYLMDHLLDCLDGRDDKITHADQQVSDSERYRLTVQSVLIMKCKKTALEIYGHISKLRGDYRLSIALKLFERKFDSKEYDGARKEV